MSFDVVIICQNVVYYLIEERIYSYFSLDFDIS